MTFILIELFGKAVGFAKLFEGSTAEGIDGANAIEIKRIYILEKVQGKNVGLKLIQKCLWFHHMKIIELLYIHECYQICYQNQYIRLNYFRDHFF